MKIEDLTANDLIVLADLLDTVRQSHLLDGPSIIDVRCEDDVKRVLDATLEEDLRGNYVRISWLDEALTILTDRTYQPQEAIETPLVDPDAYYRICSAVQEVCGIPAGETDDTARNGAYLANNSEAVRAAAQQPNNPASFAALCATVETEIGRLTLANGLVR